MDDCEDCGCCPEGGNLNRDRRRNQTCGIAAFGVFILLFAASWDALDPTEYGLVQNGFTGYVDMRPGMVYEGGRYLVWLRHYFLTFPRNLRNLEFDYDGRRPPIPARTGPDPDDKESGGQPVTFSVSFQYKLQKHTVPQVYQTYGLAWEASYMRFAQQAITNVAQQFTPKQFWNDRCAIYLREAWLPARCRPALTATAPSLTLRILFSSCADYHGSLSLTARPFFPSCAGRRSKLLC